MSITTPVSEPFPLEQIASETEESAEAFRDQSAVLEAAALIRHMREEAKLTQRDLAKIIGTSQPHLSDLERGTGSLGPTFLMLRKIANACGSILRVEVVSKAQHAKEVEASRAAVASYYQYTR